MRWLLPFCLLAAACGGDDTIVTPSPVEPPPPMGEGLERVHRADPALVAEGERAFAEHALVQGVLPPEAMRHLYVSWSESLLDLGTYYMDEDAYRAAFDARYGTIPSPFEGATLPAGFGVASDGQIGIDCLLCHAGRLEGRTIVGLSNNRLDLRAFVEDLQALPAAIEALKARDDIPPPYDALVGAIPDVTVPEPYASLEVPTGAAGLNDGFGLGLVTAAFYREPPAGMDTFMGYQDAPPWWTVGFAERLYTDGAADAGGVYTMMSTLLAFGLSFAELTAYLPTFEAIRHFMCAMEPPRWDDFGLPAVDAELAAEGEVLFAAECASCHGDHRGGRMPNHIDAGEIGTDPFRAARFGEDEAAFFNGFIPEAQYEMQATGGYLAPALVGIWASAPYLHNGSVPTLRALLVPSLRPERWRRLDGYDAAALGLSYEEVDAPTDRDTVEGRRVVDTTVEGLGRGGHELGPFSDQEVEALLAYLATL